MASAAGKQWADGSFPLIPTPLSQTAPAAFGGRGSPPSSMPSAARSRRTSWTRSRRCWRWPVTATSCSRRRRRRSRLPPARRWPWRSWSRTWTPVASGGTSPRPVDRQANPHEVDLAPSPQPPAVEVLELHRRRRAEGDPGAAEASDGTTGVGRGVRVR